MTNQQKQCLLYYLGYYKGNIDGKIGPKSKDAIKSFRKDYGLTVDGVVGENTIKALKQAITYGMPTKTKNEDWWNEIKYFNKNEFACKCGGKYCKGYPAEMNEKVVKMADKVHKHFGVAVTVSSGLRCAKHNTNIGGVTNSRHKLGKAIDFCVEGKTSDEILYYVRNKQTSVMCMRLIIVLCIWMLNKIERGLVKMARPLLFCRVINNYYYERKRIIR